MVTNIKLQELYTKNLALNSAKKEPQNAANKPQNTANNTQNQDSLKTKTEDKNKSNAIKNFFLKSNKQNLISTVVIALIILISGIIAYRKKPASPDEVKNTFQEIAKSIKLFDFGKKSNFNDVYANNGKIIRKYLQTTSDGKSIVTIKEYNEYGQVVRVSEFIDGVIEKILNKKDGNHNVINISNEVAKNFTQKL